MRGRLKRKLPPTAILPSAAFVLVAGLLLAAPGTVTAQPTSVDMTVAAGYFRRADELYRSGDSARALELVDRSLEFQPNFSDGLYLQGRICMERQETLHRARSALQLALESGNWLSVSPREAEVSLARVYVLTRRFGEAERLLRSVVPDLGLGGNGSAELAELWAASLIGLGRPNQAEAQLERALRRYPGSPGLHVLAADLLNNRHGGGTEAAALLDRALGESPGSPELLFARARVDRDPKGRLGFLERYFHAGGGDPGAALLMLTSLLSMDPAPAKAAEPANGETAGREEPTGSGGRAPEAEAALERFFQLGGGRRIRLIDSLRDDLLTRTANAEVGPGDGRSVARSLYARLLDRADTALSGYSGERVVDSERDGLYEELYQYADGRLISWLLDQDQDGLPEARVELADGEPARLVFPAREAEQESVEYLFSRYPYLDRIAYTGGGSRRVYRLTPFRYLAQVVRPVAVEAPTSAVSPDHPLGRRLVARPATTEAEARARSSRMEEYLLPVGERVNSPDRVYTLLNGETVRIDEDPDPQGRYRRYVLLAGGTPVSGHRDLDDDGRFEVSEEYARGVLQRIALDQDGDGSPELVELFETGGRSASEKRWDYDNDGRFDSRELTLADGGVVREFSSRLDGRFDLRAVFRGGRLAEFRKAGRLLPVRYDPARNLYRIGSSRDWGELPGVLTEGLHRSGSTRLFVFDYGGNTYIGELE